MREDREKQVKANKLKEDTPILYCGVTHLDGTPYKMTKEEQEKFIKGCGKNAVFCEDMPPLMKLIASIK